MPRLRLANISVDLLGNACRPPLICIMLLLVNRGRDSLYISAPCANAISLICVRLICSTFLKSNPHVSSSPHMSETVHSISSYFKTSWASSYIISISLSSTFQHGLPVNTLDFSYHRWQRTYLQTSRLVRSCESLCNTP